GLTWKLGVFSWWKGQSPLKLRPTRASFTDSATRATISVRSFTSAIVSGVIMVRGGARPRNASPLSRAPRKAQERRRVAGAGMPAPGPRHGAGAGPLHASLLGVRKGGARPVVVGEALVGLLVLDHLVLAGGLGVVREEAGVLAHRGRRGVADELELCGEP